MWEIYDELIEHIDARLRVTDCYAGRFRAVLACEAGCGMASLLLNNHAPNAQPHTLSHYIGRPLREVAALVKRFAAEESVVGMAAINAYYNNQPLLREAASFQEEDIFDALLPEARGKRVASVGHFFRVRERYQDICDFTIFERQPQQGDLPDTAEEYLLPGMELVFLTGMAFANKTMPRLLALTRGAKTVVVGPTTTLSPMLFAYGADVLSGVIVEDLAGCKYAVMEGRNPRDIYGYVRRVTITRESGNALPHKNQTVSR